MFDSDGSGKVPTEHITDHTEPVATDEVVSEPTHFDTTPAEPVGEPAPSGAPRTKHPYPDTIHTPFDDQTRAHNLKLDIEDRIKANTIQTGSTIRTGTTIRTGKDIFTGGFNNESIYNNEKLEFPHLSVIENKILQAHSAFGDNPFHLTENKLIETFYANQKDITEIIFQNKPSSSVWEDLSNKKAIAFMDHTTLTDGDTAKGRLGDYLNVLKKFSNLEPKKGFFKKESVEEYIAHALQKLESEGTLNIFRNSVRK
jgi:hypothetical protein